MVAFQFKVDGDWWTWIDYDKFHALMGAYMTSGQTFSATDYMAPTPPWAVYGAEERGFDPVEKRFFRAKKREGEGQ